MRVEFKFPEGLEGGVYRSSYAPGKIRQKENHNEIELILVVRGVVAFLVDGQKIVLKRHDQIFIFPKQEHVLIHETPDCLKWVLLFSRALLKRVCRSPQSQILLESDPKGAFCTTLSQNHAMSLCHLFEEVSSLQSTPDHFNAGLDYILMTAWNAQQHEYSMIPSQNVHPSVKKAAQLLYREEEGMSTRELSRLSGLGISRLRRVFKQQLGVSLADYRNRQRLQRFLALYGNGQSRNIMESSFEAGFGSYPQFHRVFKKLMGFTPATYRKNTLKSPV